MDGLFLCLWAATNFGVHFAINKIHLEGSDEVIAMVLQALFGLATLVPIAIFIYRDIRIMWVRANQKIATVSHDTDR